MECTTEMLIKIYITFGKNKYQSLCNIKGIKNDMIIDSLIYYITIFTGAPK